MGLFEFDIWIKKEATELKGKEEINMLRKQHLAGAEDSFTRLVKDL